MLPPKLHKKLLSAGYQLTQDAYKYLSSYPDLAQAIDLILKSHSSEIILDVDHLQTILEAQISEFPNKKKKKEEIVKQEKAEKTETKKIRQSKGQTSGKMSQDTTPPTHIRHSRAETDLDIIYSPKASPSSVSVKDFYHYFESRYSKIAQLFEGRKDIPTTFSTTYLQSLEYKDKIAVIALVYDKTQTRKGTIILELEDLEGRIKAIIPASHTQIIDKASHILEDTVLCFKGNWQNNVLYVKDVFWPDIPYGREPNYADEDVFALFISDIHIGSKNFMGELFLKAINFVNGELSSSSKYNSLGKKIKYLFVGGDLVDGIGIYPGHEDDLALDSLAFQYLLASENFERIDSDVEIVIIPGNHDGARAAEPQTPIQRDFAPDLYRLDNVHLVGSPAYVKAHNVEVLMSHGNSIIDINATITDIPNESSAPAMVEMLKNRHLVPIYGTRTPIAPMIDDQLVISQIPDIFHTGHTHIAQDDKYKGVTVLNSGTFQAQTEYQKSMNINPTIGETYIVNLKTLQRTRIDFKKIS